MVYKFFDKKPAGSGVNTHVSNEHPLDLAEALQIIRKF